MADICNVSLKHLRYREKGEIVYSMYTKGIPSVPGPACVFSAAPGNAGSTVLGAEDIIEVICRQEGIMWGDVHFFDLHTHHSGGCRSRGLYGFSALTVKSVPSPYHGKEPSCFVD